jgi:hypothetical protein
LSRESSLTRTTHPTALAPANALGRGPAQGGHLIQDLAAEGGRTLLLGSAPGSKGLAEDRRVSEEHAFRSRLSIEPLCSNGGIYLTVMN